MKVEEKSKALVDYYDNLLQSQINHIVYLDTSKKCALKCVEEIKQALENYEKFSDVNDMDGDFIYWNEVKQLLLKL